MQTPGWKLMGSEQRPADILEKTRVQVGKRGGGALRALQPAPQLMSSVVSRQLHMAHFAIISSTQDGAFCRRRPPPFW